MERVPITRTGSLELKKELERLIKHDRYAISQAIAEARAMGDLKENAEYHAAREKQSFIEGRIAELESILSSAQVIDISEISNEGKVIFGTTVSIKNVETGKTTTYKIVGDCEANIEENKIAITSPIARVLISNHLGEIVKFADAELEIISVEYIA